MEKKLKTRYEIRRVLLSVIYLMKLFKLNPNNMNTVIDCYTLFHFDLHFYFCTCTKNFVVKCCLCDNVFCKFAFLPEIFSVFISFIIKTV